MFRLDAFDRKHYLWLLRQKLRHKFYVHMYEQQRFMKY